MRIIASSFFAPLSTGNGIRQASTAATILSGQDQINGTLPARGDMLGLDVTVREKRLDNPGRPYITGTTDITFFRSMRYAVYACREDACTYLPPERVCRWVVVGCSFAPGISALIYAIAWTRLLNLLFGDTVLAVSAVSTVLASFMAGLALGGLWGAPVWLQFAKTFAVILLPTLCMGGTVPQDVKALGKLGDIADRDALQRDASLEFAREKLVASRQKVGQ
jgi:hypothetical protein